MLTAKRPERTLARETMVRGISFLSGLDVTLRFRPADAGNGVRFVRSDLPGSPFVPAHVRHVQPRQRRTALQHGEAIVEMVEHVMAALSGLRIDNCIVEIDGPETPGCDGSSQAFVEALIDAGAVEQDRPREVLVIDHPIHVREGVARAWPPTPADGIGWSCRTTSTTAGTRRSPPRAASSTSPPRPSATMSPTAGRSSWPRKPTPSDRRGSGRGPPRPTC